MKKLALIILFAVVSCFARTETVELTGKYSEMLGNPFKRILVEKTKTINIYSEDKEVVLEVEDNLENSSFIFIAGQESPEKIIINNKDLENIAEDFYGEDYIVNKDKEGAFTTNIVKGSVFLTYSNQETNESKLLTGVEITLVISINGEEQKITMNQNVDKPIAYKGHITSDDFEFKKTSLDERIKEIVENIIYKGLRNENNN